MSLSLVDQKEERDRIARLNLIAGIEAKHANALSVAIEHFILAYELVEDDIWQWDYEVTSRSLNPSLSKTVTGSAKASFITFRAVRKALFSMMRLIRATFPRIHTFKSTRPNLY